MQEGSFVRRCPTVRQFDCPTLESGRPDSNRRRPAWEAGILPLNYARKGPAATPPIYPRTPQSKGPGDRAPGPSQATSSVPYGVCTFLKFTNEPLYPTSVNVHPKPVGQVSPLPGNVCCQPLCTTSHTV